MTRMFLGFVSFSLYKVKLVPYDPHYLDKSVLWSKSGNMTHDFHYIRHVDHIYLNFDICGKGHSGVQDDTKLMLSTWCEDGNQYWRMVPWRESPCIASHS